MSRRGKIYSVACNDFVTYDEVIFFPGEHLNIIIGPNGTGKSTLVAAIVMGMGGKPELLSRSSALADWIKHGCDEALIEINIFTNETETIAFQRHFNKQGLDEYKIEDKKYSRKQFLARVKEFNIQVENLCQFLPQDRVQDFAKMNPQELLANTQLSVCSEEVQNRFASLLDLRQQQQNVGKDAKLRQKELEDLQAKNEALRPQIENIRARGDLVKEVEIGNKKLAWLEYEVANAKVVEYTNDLNQAQTKLLDAKKKLEPVQKEAEAMIRERNKMQSKIQTDQEAARTIKTEQNKLHEQLTRLSKEMRTAKGELQDAIGRARDRKHEINQASQMLAGFKQDLVDLMQKQKPEAEISAKREELTQKYRQMTQQKKQLSAKRNDLQDEIRNIRMNIDNVKNRITRIENVEVQKIRKLQERDSGCYQAYEWLRQNRHRFKGHIYNPIMMELQVIDQKYAKFLENTVQTRDFYAFVCEDPDDMDLFLDETRKKQNLKVNAICSEPSDQLVYRSAYPIDQMRRYGFQMYLTDIVKAPFPILNYLCKSYQIHNVPICDESTGMNVDSLPREIRVFYTPTKRFQVNVSRYTGAKSTMSNDIRMVNLLDTGVNTAALEQFQQQMNTLTRDSDRKRQECTQTEEQIKRLEDKLSELNQEVRDLDESKNAVKSIQDRINRQQQKLDEKIRHEINIPAERAKYKQRATQIVANMIRVHETMNKTMDVFVKNQISVETQRKKLEIFRRANHAIDTKIHMLEEEVTRSKRLADTIQGHVEHARNEMKTKERNARKLTDNKLPSDRNFPYKTQFNKLPKSIDELTKVITDLQARIDCMGATDQSIIEEFEQRAAKIEKMAKEIRGTKNRETDLQSKIEEIHAEWYSEISDVVETINQNFSRFMSLMNLAGEVELTRQGEHDYTDYGITIRVKYRAADKMAVLDRTYQSGGERAVAIAVYTLSLQHLSHVPFRCVDEINQGMDPKNERKIFEMLVNETCQPGNSQYFFITPKLLPNLHYNELMNVFIVHNGKFIDDPFVFVKNQLQ